MHEFRTADHSRLAETDTPAPEVRRSLTVGSTTDPAEHDADQVADRVLRAIAQPAVAEAPIRRAPLAGEVIQRVPFKYASESAHYSKSRDAAHSDAKAALLAADADNAVSKKLYSKGKGGKLVASIPSGEQYMVVVAYVNKDTGELKYDTAYYSKTPAAPGDTGQYWNPTSLTIG